MENKKHQAHIDMVLKNEDTVHDFTTDPIRPYIDDWVKSRHNLGSDNGIEWLHALPFWLQQISNMATKAAHGR